MSFEALKKTRNKSISKLVAAAEKVGGDTKNYGDDRIWKPTVDKAGNGYAVIRFLPSPDGEDLPWARYWDHGFKGPSGRWYIERSLTSVGQDDPVGALNSRLWNSGRDEDKETARKQKRRLHYVSNILVITDSGNPETEGKVFLYQYGKKIFDKVLDVMQPQFEDEDPMNPFDFWEGANFKLKIRQVEGYRNYDKSEFDKPSTLSEDEDYLKGIYDQLHTLGEFTDPKNYKSYDELEKKLIAVLGSDAVQTTVRQSVEMDTTATNVSVPRETPQVEPPQTTAEDPISEDEDQEGLSYFAKLAQED